MKQTIGLGMLFFTAAVFLFYFVNQNNDPVTKQHSEKITVYSVDHANVPPSQTKTLDTPFNAFAKYSLCFHYATTGLSQPNLQISDAQISQPSTLIDLPRNSWGLGDVCLSIMPKDNYTNPKLSLLDNGNNSSFSISNISINPETHAFSSLFDRPLLNDKVAEIQLQSNFITIKFVLPIVVFLLLWLGSGFVFTSFIVGLTKLEIWFVTPVMGMVVLSFLAYTLSLLGIYNIPVLILVVLTISYVAYTKNQHLLKLGVSPAFKTPSPSENYNHLKFGYFFEICAAILIAITMLKYVCVAATPFYFNDWDGIVSWNKWGADWALREERGNYQFTYPQMIPLLYSVYYKLIGYSALDPLTLSMNTVHALNTFLGLLSLPLVYVCSKALNTNPIIPVLCVLSFRFLDMVNTGFVDTTLVTYNLVCALVILKGCQVAANVQNNTTSYISICLLGAGAIFLKQIGIFASLAILAFLLIHYRRILISKKGFFLFALIAVVPAEFYLHEALLDAYPLLADNNPLNHSIGGVISNAGTQTSIVSSLSWYTILAGKILGAIGGSGLSKLTIATGTGIWVSLLVAFSSIGFYGFISYKLYCQKNWSWLAVWGLVVGGQLIVASLFGSRFDLRYILTLIPILGFIIAISVEKTWRSKHKRVLTGLFPLTALLMVYLLLEFHPKPPAPSTNGYDMISYEERLKRFFAPDFTRVEEYLVAQSNQGFKFSTDSTFVTWPNTIFAGRSREEIFKPGDYFYTVTQKTCPPSYIEIMKTNTAIQTTGRLCQKTKELPQ
jgi:hypothetical protein